MRVQTRGRNFHGAVMCCVRLDIRVHVSAQGSGFCLPNTSIALLFTRRPPQFEAKINKVTCLLIFQSIRLTFCLFTKTFAVFFCSFLVSVLFTWRLPSQCTAAPCECCVQPWRSKLSDVARPLFLIPHWKLSMKTAGFPSAGPLKVPSTAAGSPATGILM